MTYHPEAGNLIVALDPKVDPKSTFPVQADRLRKELERDLKSLSGLGIIVKLNTYIRLLGLAYVVELLREHQLFLFADLKLFDIHDTVEKDLQLLRLDGVTKIVTIAAGVKPEVFETASKLLFDCAIAPVGPLTDLEDPDFQFWHWMPGVESRMTRQRAVENFFARIDRLVIPNNNLEPICGPKDVALAPERLDTITPGVKTERQGIDRNSANATTPTKAIHIAIRRGRNSRLVIGRGITNVGIPMDAAAREIMDEMAHARNTFAG